MREAAVRRRAALAAAVPDLAGRVAAFADALELGAAVIVSGYSPMRGEADPRLLMAALAGRGHVLALPRVVRRGEPLAFHRWAPGDATQIVAFGLTEPLSDAEQVVPSALLVPLLAFDAAGYRLGYGGGYYDRTLAKLRMAASVRAIGVAFSGQQVQAVPRDAHDQPLDAIVTERGMLRFTR